MTLESIGEGDDALLCVTDLRNCCRHPYTGEIGIAVGNWFFPNGTVVRSNGNQWDIYRTRGHMIISLHHKKGGVNGIYRCEIPDTMNIIQTMYIRLYSADTDGEYGHYAS